MSRGSLAKAMVGVLVGLLACLASFGSGIAVAAAAGAPQGPSSFAAKPPRGSVRAALSIGHGRGHGVVYFAGNNQSKAVRTDCSTSCAGPLFYHGGPVMHTPTAYTIYWEPAVNLQLGTAFTKFPAKYRPLIDGFMEDVTKTSAPLDNVFSVDRLYGDSGAPGSYGWRFGGGFLDTATLPIRDPEEHCPEASSEEEIKEAEGKAGLPPKGQPCVTDAQLQAQLREFIESKGLPTGLGALYFLVTPEHLNSCVGGKGAQAECTTNVFCAYHSDFQASGSRIVYANMPFADRPGCALPDQPNGEAADDEIDVISHEGNEAITDPLIEPGLGGWFDYFGQEVADKCTYPFFEPLIDFDEELDAYGPLLGGVPAVFQLVEEKGETHLRLTKVGSAYNQLVNGGTYMLQREWSDVAGGCVPRAPVPAASFAVYSSPGVAGQAIAFNGSASTTPAGTLTSYSWSFGDGSPEVAGPQPAHTYASPGAYSVRLTVTNNSGASSSTTQSVSVVTPAPAPEALTKTVSVLVPVEPTAYTASQLASKLGLPANGAKLSAKGPIRVGHAECPPACTVTVRLYAVRHVAVHGHRVVKRVFIGALTIRVGAKGSRPLTLTLNATGRKLLHRSHRLPSQLLVSVTGKEGGSWQISRTLTLTR